MTLPPNLPRLLTQQEAAHMLSVSRSKFNKLRKANLLPAPVVLGTKMLRYREQDIHDMIERLIQRPDDEALEAPQIIESSMTTEESA